MYIRFNKASGHYKAPEYSARTGLADGGQWLSSLRDSKAIVRGIVINISETKTFKIKDFSPLYMFNDKPIAFIISNPYHKTLLERQDNRPKRSQITYTYSEAFAYMAAEALQTEEPTLPEGVIYLNANGATTIYDPEKHRFQVIYYGVVTPGITAEVYGTMAITVQTYGARTIQGGSFDFRHVTEFSNANLNTVRSTSTNLNTSHDLSKISRPQRVVAD